MISRVKINANQEGLVFKNGKLVRVISEGNHWLLYNEEMIRFDKVQQFVSPCEITILLKNTELSEKLEVVEVKDGEIVLVFVNGTFFEALRVGTHAFWKGIFEYNFLRADISQPHITADIPAVILQHPKLAILVRKFTVLPHESALLYIDGKYEKQLGPGAWYFWNNGIAIEVQSADTRKQQIEISGQELLSRDKATLRINFFVWYVITDIVAVLNENKEYEKQLYVIMQLALREFAGALTLDELLAKKDSIGTEILASVAAKVSAMGIELTDAGIRDVILPGEMREIMNQVLVAEKKAQANSIMRREETASTRSLLNTAKLMEENAMLYKLKEMEYVEKIAENINNISLSGSGQIVDQLKQIFVK